MTTLPVGFAITPVMIQTASWSSVWIAILCWLATGLLGGGSCNNTHVGIEMCESKYIRYLLPGEAGYSPGKFQVLDKAKAQADCKRAYNSAVELFAMLAAKYKWNVDTDICSHKEDHSRGIASNHGDPEHYWKGMGMSYTMNGFRADVKKKMKENNMTKEETQALINEAIKPTKQQVEQLIASIGQLTEAVQKLVNAPKELLDNDAVFIGSDNNIKHNATTGKWMLR